ncbi:hypothetical protein [Chryseolinea lacunae]|uniref:Lipoprotein n=1 Tax=Chryseolinea lacunae TaxID=2801331 RepID=A0ABS1L2M8_9BACT|nr:hypothetical protein [Chryseolinea lacunae]MBL0745894.1 hypothetical protein [Chryseolinea lacunae]
MRKIVLLLTSVAIGSIFTCCDKQRGQYSYPNNEKISKSNGEPIDSLSFFFPIKLVFSDSTLETGLDTFRLQWYSSQLFPSMEPVLFNYYLGRDIYRLSWLRSFHEPVFLTLYKNGGKVWMTVKQLDRQPDFMPTRIIPQFALPKVGEPYDTTRKIEELNSYPIQPPDRHANLKVNQTKVLSMSEWNEFESRLRRAGYWTMAPTQDVLGLDGSEWIIEAHFRNKYHVVDRWSPEDRYKEAGVYLIKLSGLNEDIY